MGYFLEHIQKSFNSQKFPIFILSHIFSSPHWLWCLESGLCLGKISVPGIYVETYLYDDVYVHLLITSYLRTCAHSVR